MTVTSQLMKKTVIVCSPSYLPTRMPWSILHNPEHQPLRIAGVLTGQVARKERYPSRSVHGTEGRPRQKVMGDMQPDESVNSSWITRTSVIPRQNLSGATWMDTQTFRELFGPVNDGPSSGR